MIVQKLCNYFNPVKDTNSLDINSLDIKNCKNEFFKISQKKENFTETIEQIVLKWQVDSTWLEELRVDELVCKYISDFQKHVGLMRLENADGKEIILNIDLLEDNQIDKLILNQQDELIKEFKDNKDNNNTTKLILLEKIVSRLEKYGEQKKQQKKIQSLYKNIFEDLKNEWRAKAIFIQFISEKNFEHLPTIIIQSFFENKHTDVFISFINNNLEKHRRYFLDKFKNSRVEDFKEYYSNINKYSLSDISNIVDYINNKDFLELLIRIDEKTYKENKESIKEHIKEITFNNVEDIEYYMKNIVKLKEVLKIEDDEFDKLNKENIKKIKRFLEENKDTYPNCFIDLLKNYKEKGKYFREVLIKYFDISKENDIFIYEFLPKCIADLRESNIVEWDDFSEATKFLKLSDSEKEILKNNNIKITKEVEKFDNEKLMNFIEEDKEVGQSNDVENIIQELKDDITTPIGDEILDLFRKKLKSKKANLRQS